MFFSIQLNVANRFQNTLDQSDFEKCRLRSLPVRKLIQHKQKLVNREFERVHRNDNVDDLRMNRFPSQFLKYIQIIQQQHKKERKKKKNLVACQLIVDHRVKWGADRAYEICFECACVQIILQIVVVLTTHSHKCQRRVALESVGQQLYTRDINVVCCAPHARKSKERKKKCKLRFASHSSNWCPSPIDCSWVHRSAIWCLQCRFDSLKQKKKQTKIESTKKNNIAFFFTA